MTTLKQKRFIDFYKGNATEAAVAAGYSAKTARSQGHMSVEATVVVGEKEPYPEGTMVWFDHRNWLQPGETIQMRGTVPQQGGDGGGIYVYRGETYQTGIYGMQRGDEFWMEPVIPMQPDGFDVLGISSLQYPNVNSFLVSAYDGLGPPEASSMSSDQYVDARIRAEVTEFSMIVTGDSNRDGAFDSGDLVTAFTAGKYGTGELASWEDGDWNASTKFDSNDFVIAFQTGLYEAPPMQTTRAVPEPSTFAMLMLGLLSLSNSVRRNA